MRPVLLQPGGSLEFPDPRRFDDEGLVAVGGDLSGARLLAAYDAGVFPWYNDGYPPLWWSPNPRAVLSLESPHISRSMRRCLRGAGGKFVVSWNSAFEEVMRACAEERKDGTWITQDMLAAYVGLHRQGHAFSIEVRMDGAMVGGLYGVQRGALFAAESMFHRVSNMSKVALLYAAETLRVAGVKLFDVQFVTPHLRSLGAIELDRDDYLRRVARYRSRNVDLVGLKAISPLER